MNIALKSFFRPRVSLLLILLGIFGYWYFAVHPYIRAQSAVLSAPFLEVRADQPGRLAFAPYREGDKIKEGDVLFSFSNFEEKQRQKQLQANVDSIQKMLTYYAAGVEQATENYFSARKDADLGAGSSQSIELALTALQEQQLKAQEYRQQLAAAQETLELANQLAAQKATKAPFSGVIVDRRKREGDVLSFGEIVYSLCDPGQVWVEALVSEKHIAQISVGQKAIISLSDNKRKWEGAVSWISPMALPLQKGVPVRILLAKNDGNFLLPNLSADVKIKVH